MHQRPWFRLPTAEAPGSQAEQNVLQRICSAIDSTLKSKQQRLVDDYCASWLYQRDYMIAQYGSAHASLQNAPDGAAEALSHIKDDFEVQSPAIVKSAVDTVRNWLFSETPPIGVKAANATFEMRSAIDMYGIALDGIMNTEDNADTEAIIARDGSLKGFGAAWPQFEAGDVKVKRLHSHQVSYDPHDSRDGKPQCMYITEYRDKYAMLDWLKAFEDVPFKEEKLKAIENAPIQGTSSSGSSTNWTIYDWELASQGISDSTPRIEVTHCFRLASSPTAKDGRYVVFVRGSQSSNAQGTILLDQVFERTSHPVVWWTASPNDEGIRGSGLYHDLRTWQSAIDRHMYKIQKTADKYGWPKIYVPKGSIRNLSAFAEAGVYVIEYDPGSGMGQVGAAPAITLLKEDIEWVDKLMSMAMSINGINAMMATGGSRLGAGASAVALVEENFRATDRLSSILKRWKRFKIELARQVLYVLDDVLATVPDYRAQFDYKGTARSMKWADLRKQTGNSVIDVEMRGELAGTRAGRMATIVDLASRRLIDEATAQEMMLSTPDVRRAARISLAGTRYVEWQLDNLVRNADLDVSMPTEDMDDQTLATAVDRATKYMYLARVEGARDETIQRLRSYKLQAEQLLRVRVPAAPAQAGPAQVPQI